MQHVNQPVKAIVEPALPNFDQDREYYKPKRRMKSRLPDALELYGRPASIETTLLKQEVHERHTGWLSARFIETFIRQFNERNEQVRKTNAHLCTRGMPEIPELTQEQFANAHVRFFTLLYEVVDMDRDCALGSVTRMSNALVEATRKTRGIYCLGAVEVEPISIPLLEVLHESRANRNGINALDDSTERHRQKGLLNDHRERTSRKLMVCKGLWTGFQSPVFSGGYCQLLVHFHGVLIANDEKDFDRFRSKLQKIPAFNKIGYQIEIKRLTNAPWADKTKTPTENLHCIANYITKGAPSRTKNDEAEYKFKVKFDHGYALAKAQADALESIDQLIVDATNGRCSHDQYRLDLSKIEVFVLADTINHLMNLKTNRTGYLLQVGGWSSGNKK